MARKKKEEAVETPKRNAAEEFAYQRRLRVFPQKKGEQLLQDLVDAGFKVHTRGNAELTQVSVLSPHRFVIDLTNGAD